LSNLDSVAAGEARAAQSAAGASRGFNGRWTRRQWLQASLLGTTAALVFALVPGFSSALQVHDGNAHMATMALALPPAPEREAAVLASQCELVRVEPGQTLGEIFADQGVPVATMHRLLETESASTALARIRPGTELGFEFDSTDGRLVGFRFDRSQTRSEEHTSELQSREKLACRLLLEKK